MYITAYWALIQNSLLYEYYVRVRRATMRTNSRCIAAIQVVHAIHSTCMAYAAKYCVIHNVVFPNLVTNKRRNVKHQTETKPSYVS